MAFAGEDGEGISVAERVASLEETLANFDKIKDLPADVFASNWTANLITNYKFANDSSLKGLSIGASMNARGKKINGYGVDENNVLDTDVRYYTPATETFGAWIGYGRKIMNDKVNWKIQLNIRNLFDQDTLQVLRDVDTRDGNHTPSVALYRLAEPRTLRLTNTFRF